MTQSNGRRMSFAEWLYNMANKQVPYQARSLAVYAVALRVTANDELAKLAGMDTKGLADKTYNKWKSYLSANGWVIVKQVVSGRTRTIEVYPAIDGSPVTFTDLVQRDHRKFDGNLTVKVTVTDTVESTVTEQVEITAGAVKVTPGTVKSTGELPQDAGAPTRERAQFEFPSGIDSIPKKASQLDREPDVDGERLAGLNGSADQMIDDLLIWMGHRSTPYNARQWLAQMVHTFGADVIAQSYAKLQTDLVTGAVIAKPMQTWSSIAQRMKAQPATRPKSFLENLTKMAAEAEERMGRK